MLAARIGTAIQYSAPYTPTDKGFMERFWRTLRDHWMSGLDMREYHDLDELREALYRYINAYNHTSHPQFDIVQCIGVNGVIDYEVRYHSFFNSS